MMLVFITVLLIIKIPFKIFRVHDIYQVLNSCQLPYLPITFNQEI